MARSSVELIVDASKAINPLKRVTSETRKLEGATRDANGRLRDSRGRFISVGKSATQASKGVNNLAGAIRGLVAGFGIFQAGKFVIFKTAELERQTKSLEVLTGSLGNARNIISELQQFGAVTPFTSTELIETAKRLKAFGFETEQVVDVTKRLADVAGATGADLGGIATAFGQIQAKGRLQGEELLQLQERGVGLQDELQKMYGLTADEFRKALEGGRISADAVNLALQNITKTGGKYANGAIAQSETLSGKFSTLVDQIERVARTIGEVLTPALKGALSFAIQVVDRINQAFAAASVTEQQKQGFKLQAEQEVMRFAGPMPGGPFGAGEVVVRHLGKTYKGSASSVVSQITNDLINQEVQRRVVDARGPGFAPVTMAEPPALLNRTTGSGVGGTSAGKERVDMSARMLELNRRLRSEQEAGNAREIATLELMVRRQEIAESALLTTERQNALEEALFNFRRKIFDLDEKAKKEPMSMDFADLFKREQSKIEQFIESGKQSLQDLQQVAINVSQGIGDAIANALTSGIQGLIDGSAKVKDVFANLLSSVGQVLAQEGAKMISTYIAIGIAKAFAGLGGGKFDAAPLGAGFSTGATASGFDAVGAGLFSPMANGGPVRGGQPYMVGERGPELFVPGQGGGIMRNEDMRRMMGNSPAGNAGMSMNFTFETTSIGGTEYVSREQLESAMATTRRQAASDGAKRGMNMTLDRMQNSPRTRARVGIS